MEQYLPIIQGFIIGLIVGILSCLIFQSSYLIIIFYIILGAVLKKIQYQNDCDETKLE